MNKIREAFQRFMYGRYGSDRLNQAMLIVFLVCAMLDIFVDNVYFSVLLTSWEFLLVILIYFRVFSRNISKRYAEIHTAAEKGLSYLYMSPVQTENPYSKGKR